MDRMPPKLIEVEGGSNPQGADKPLPPGAVVTKDETGDSVTVVVTNLWEVDANVSAYYYTSDVEDKCDPRSQVAVDATVEFTLFCFDNGLAELNLYVYFGEGVSPEKCSNCEAPEAGSDAAVGYYLSIDCRPDCEAPTAGPTTPDNICDENPPSEPECPEDISFKVTDGVTEFPYNPITIVQQNTHTVDFTVTNPFPEGSSTVFVQFKDSALSGTECYGDGELVPCETKSYTAYCLYSKPEAIVDVWYVNDLDLQFEDGYDDAEIPECCHPEEDDAGKGTVHYTFVLQCASKCVRRLDALEEGPRTTDNNASKTIKPIVRNKELCTAKSHPCGEEKDLVEVCHYSTKSGYQTYCVPESDAEVMAYYPDDYCGPCKTASYA